MIPSAQRSALAAWREAIAAAEREAERARGEYGRALAELVRTRHAVSMLGEAAYLKALDAAADTCVHYAEDCPEGVIDCVCAVRP